MGKNNANIPDLQSLIQAGINPNTGLPIKLGIDGLQLKDNIRKNLRVLDEQNALKKGRWYNLPNGLTGELIERILYYRGQGMFFYMEADGNFYFLPYALDGTIDVYGRFKGVTPVPFNGKNTTENDKAWITGLTKNVIYDPFGLEEDEIYDAMLNGCVLLSDYCKQMSQTNIPRQILNDPILDIMAEALPFARTNLLANSGITAMRVNDETEESNVKAASRSVTRAALTGDPFIPVVGHVEFQDMTSSGSPIKSEEYLLYMQAIDNYRLSTHGLKNGGLFQKKSHMLEAEQDVNMGSSTLVMQDLTDQRQEFCDAVNAIWGLGIWYEPAEQVIGVDRNGDGQLGDEQDQSGAAGGEQPQEVSQDE